MSVKYLVGIDIGSTAVKLAVLESLHETAEEGDLPAAQAGEGSTTDAGPSAPPRPKLLHTAVAPTGFSSVDAAERMQEQLEAAGFPLDECSVVSTGYGRAAVSFAERSVTEITCHGRGAAYLFGPDGVVVDIGGQDTKAIVLSKGRVTKFAMNDKCSAGTGKFLEVMANRMGVSQDELSQLARRGEPTQISSMCTVFAESEVISLIGAGTPRENIAWGVIESVAAKVRPLVPQSQMPVTS